MYAACRRVGWKTAQGLGSRDMGPGGFTVSMDKKGMAALETDMQCIKVQ
jgi:hypothetical protein